MFKKSLAERNLRINREIEQKALRNKDMINGQALGGVSQMRYGLCSAGYCGCGCIAVYNALVWQGKARPLSEIIYNMEKYRIILGILGCNPLRLGNALSRYGAAFVRSGNVDEAEGFIISFRTRRFPISPVHTVFCVRSDEGITVYNRYNSSPEPKTYRSIVELTHNRRPAAVYILKKKPQ